MAGAADVDFGARSHFETLRSCAGGLTPSALAQVTSTGPWVVLKFGRQDAEMNP